MRRSIIRAIFIVAATSMVACTTAGIPGDVNESVSKFDGTKKILMEPAWACSMCSIKLGLYKTTKMPEHNAVMIAVVTGAHNFRGGKSLHFNVDGDFFSFASIDTMTDVETHPGYVAGNDYYPPSNTSSMSYWVTVDFVERLVNAKRVIVKIDLAKDYVEGEFPGDHFTTVRPGFRDFYEKVKAW
jgi:hypothetical protein